MVLLMLRDHLATHGFIDVYPLFNYSEIASIDEASLNI